MEYREIEKDLKFTQMVLDVINNVKTPMLVYDEEKVVVKQALCDYRDRLEAMKLRDMRAYDQGNKIQLVIEIDEEDYKKGIAMADAIRNSIPLPKGHGDLIDRNNIDEIVLEDSIRAIHYAKGNGVDVSISAPVLVKADTENNED